MRETEKLGEIMAVLIDNCDECPLEKICNSPSCIAEWGKFFESKVKEDGVDRSE